MNNKIELSIVIPAKNEVGNLPDLIREVALSFKGMMNYECIVVDDGSDDGMIKRLMEEPVNELPENLRVIRQPKSLGQSAAIVTGVRHAKGDLIGTLDGDGQNVPGDLIIMWEKLKMLGKQKILICGQRKNRQDNRIRKISSKIANSVRSFILRDLTSDTGCGTKLFSRQLFLELPVFDHMHRFLPALVRRCGGEVLSIPVQHRPRRYGKSKYGIGNRLFVGIVDLCGIVWLLRRSNVYSETATEVDLKCKSV